MIRESYRTNCGILYRTERFEEFDLDLDMVFLHGHTCDPGLPHSRILPPPGHSPHKFEVHVDEEGGKAKDALCPMHDPLVHKPLWWLLEFLPIEQRKQLPDNRWKNYRSFNFGRERTIPADTGEFFVHKSVKPRIEHLGYKPRAKN